jgi:hypothetical protein
MRFTEGDRVRHRGLKFLSGIVMRVTRIPDTDQEDDRSYFCKVQLGNGQFYTDRAAEWELSAETPSFSSRGSRRDREEQLYAKIA